LIILLCILELPESPRWLILKGKEDEALHVLSALSDLPSDDQYVHSEFLAIKDTVAEMEKGTYRDLFTCGMFHVATFENKHCNSVLGRDRHFHRTVLAYIIQMFQQISGINLITYYAAFIYQNEIGLSSLKSRLLAAGNGTEYFAASWIAVFTIERLGRRTLMFFGSIGMTLSMVLLAVMNRIGGTGPGIVAALLVSCPQNNLASIMLN
jgi:hypothetical protein